jgi:hypothetical protein
MRAFRPLFHPEGIDVHMCLSVLSIKAVASGSEEFALSLPLPLEWLRSQAAAYSTVTIEARYDLCLKCRYLNEI